MLTCEWCAEEFERPNRKGPVPRFCKPSCRQRAYEKRHGLHQGRDAFRMRWHAAIDCVLNSGLLAPYIEDLWRFVDGEIDEDEFRSLFP